mmetsp:Transcript_29518/g.75106  ORF Transcript_29518/g.75106 Transcript_29518/m.75106 type:complete len:90 (+) Transcript_29518:735-1004(+)
MYANLVQYLKKMRLRSMKHEQHEKMHRAQQLLFFVASETVARKARVGPVTRITREPQAKVPKWYTRPTATPRNGAQLGIGSPRLPLTKK